MNKNLRNLAALSALALGAFAAQAQSPYEGDSSSYPSLQSTPSTLTRAAVIAELEAARANGTMPSAGDYSEAIRSVNEASSTRTRAEVQAEALAALKAGRIVSGEHSS